MANQTQIFQAEGQKRWSRFMWACRLAFFALALLLVALAASLLHDYKPHIPQLNATETATPVIALAAVEKNFIPAFYKGFASFIEHRLKDRALPQKDKDLPVRAAFYVNWDAQAYGSLKDHISQLNMVFPEWLFLDPATGTFREERDERAMSLLKHSGVSVVPMLSNYIGNNFNGDAVHLLLQDKAKQARLINALEQYLLKNGFAGINIDFEELQEREDESMLQFMQHLYTAFHAHGLIVTQDIIPFNEDYDPARLARCNDYLVLMAYDQHNAASAPGPISGQQWVEAALDKAARKVPSGKIILGMAGYGYDWAEGHQGSDITYQEALSLAAANKAQPQFDNHTYSLHFPYTEDGVQHEVYFNDAASNFNTMRFAAEYGVGGVALWRLGGEDSRIWSFFKKPMQLMKPSDFDAGAFSHVQASNRVDFMGEGEVLDVRQDPQEGRIGYELDSTEMLVSEEWYRQIPSMFVVQKYGKGDKKIVLSFDDGPDPNYTPRILDILAREKVPAVFMVVGENAEAHIPLVKRIYREGHELGNHSFTHPDMAAISNSRAALERKLTRLLLECITGHSTLLFRAPYNADSEPETVQELKPVADSRSENYLTLGESIDPNDWEPGITPDTIMRRIIQQQANGSIILLHDAGGDREATVEALPHIIHYFRSRGYRFTTVADLLGKTRDELMPPVPHGAGFYLIQANYLLAEAGFFLSQTLAALFIAFLMLGMARLLVLAALAWKQRRSEKRIAAISPAHFEPPVSVIVPAYNEAVNAVASLQKLLQTTYQNAEFIFVDDGSKDDTYRLVQEAFAGNPKVRVFTKPNGGKASALNFGIAQSVAPIVVCIDADTMLLPDAIGLLVKHFQNEKVGAVAGNVKVGNEVNLLTRWQSLEYTTAQNFDRRAMAAVNAITVVPGAIGAFRRTALEIAGGFTTDTLAEDCDLTIRIIAAGYIVSHENRAIALTEAPETVRMFLKQRFRWNFGVLQTAWKHRRLLLRKRLGWLGLFALPSVVAFQFIMPLLAPLADLLMLVGLLSGNALQVLSYYALFLLVDASVALLALAWDGSLSWRKVLLLFPQRLAYRWLLMPLVFRSYLRALRGELQAWGFLKRTGNAAEGMGMAEKTAVAN